MREGEGSGGQKDDKTKYQQEEEDILKMPQRIFPEATSEGGSQDGGG